MRILLVEDHLELASRVAKRVRQAGFDVDHVDTIEAATQALVGRPYSVALLDRRLPDGDGLRLIPTIRQMQPESRIMILTALDAVDNRIEGLDAGADDYLTKPFHLDELVARIRASLRRAGKKGSPQILLAKLAYDCETREVTVDGRPTTLLRRELALLEALMRRSGRVVWRETLISEIYGMDDDVQPHTLTTLASRLRARLEEIDAGVELHSARGLGYMIKKATSS